MNSNVKAIGEVICILGGISGTMKVINAVGGNKNIFEKFSSIIFGIGIGCFTAKFLGTAMDVATDVVDEIISDLEQEDTEDQEQVPEETETVEINGEKYVKVKEESHERDGSNQAGDIES